jgi:hypothetical protein
MLAGKVGTTSDAFTLNIDFASTILGAASLKTYPGMQGSDIANLYMQQNSPIYPPWQDEFFYKHRSWGKQIIPKSTALVVVCKDFKCLLYPECGMEQLFNMKKDPLEEYDLSQPGGGIFQHFA